MSDDNDKWLADRDLPDQLRQALDIAHEDAVDPDQVSRLHARLVPLLGWPDPSALVSPSLPPAAGAPVAASVPPAAAGIGGVVAKLAVAKWIAVTATIVTSGSFGWIGYQATQRSNVETEVPASVPDVAAAHTAPAPARAIAPTIAAGDPTSPSDPPAPAVRRSASGIPITAAATTEPAPRIPTHSAHVSATLEDEARLLKRAQAELVTAPEVTLRMTQEHVRRFGAGILAQEREVLAIEALARLGRRDAAALRLQRFNRIYPGSPHARRAAESLEHP